MVEAQVAAFRDKHAYIELGADKYQLEFDSKHNRIKGETLDKDGKTIEFTISYKSGFVEVEMKKPRGTFRKPEREATYIFKKAVVDTAVGSDVDMISKVHPHDPVHLKFQITEKGAYVPAVTDRKRLSMFNKELKHPDHMNAPSTILHVDVGLVFDGGNLLMKPDEITSHKVWEIMKKIDNVHFAENVDAHLPGFGTDLYNHIKHNLSQVAGAAESINLAFKLNELLWEIEHTSDPELQKMRVSAEMRKRHGLG